MTSQDLYMSIHGFKNLNVFLKVLLFGSNILSFAFMYFLCILF